MPFVFLSATVLCPHLTQLVSARVRYSGRILPQVFAGPAAAIAPPSH